MSFRHTVLLCAAALIPQFALAANPPPIAHGAPLISRSVKTQTPAAIVQEFGLVESVVDFCSKVDPAHKKEFERKGNQMLPKISEDNLEALRHRADYHTAYDFIQNILKGLSKADAARNCSATL